jgi:hypothetical protein
VIALLATLAAATEPFSSCAMYQPIGGTAGFDNALDAVRTNATTYGAANFARSRLRDFNVFAWDMHEVFGAAMVPSWCADPEGRIANELYAQPLDLFATNLGMRLPLLHDGPLNSRFELYYASGVTMSASGNRAVSWALPLFNAYTAVSAPFVGRSYAGRGVSVYTVDWIGGASFGSDVLSVQAGYTGTRGLYLDVTQEKVALFFNTVLSDGFTVPKPSYLLAGIEGLDIADLGIEDSPIGIFSLFYRDLPVASAPEEDDAEERPSTFERLKTGHYRQEDIKGMFDVRAAAQFRERVSVRELAFAFHSPDWRPRETSVTEGAFYVRAGLVNLPDQPTLGVKGGVRPQIRADYRLQNPDALGVRLSAQMNDPELLDLYPFAYNALGLNVELTFALED